MLHTNNKFPYPKDRNKQTLKPGDYVITHNHKTSTNQTILIFGKIQLTASKKYITTYHPGTQTLHNPVHPKNVTKIPITHPIHNYPEEWVNELYTNPNTCQPQLQQILNEINT